MKKKCFKKPLLTILFLTLSVYVYAQDSRAGGGVIKDLRGDVEILMPGTAEYVIANIGDQLTQDTVISTGFKGYAVIEIGYSSLTVRPLTRLTVTEIKAANNAETLNVSLQSGRVRVEVKPPAGTRTNMSVRSPSVVASVRGTSFEFDTRNLYVEEGVVNFKGDGNEIAVYAGSGARVDENAIVSRMTDHRRAKSTRLSPLTVEPGKISGIYRGPVRSAVPYTIGLEFVTY